MDSRWMTNAEIDAINAGLRKAYEREQERNAQGTVVLCAIALLLAVAATALWYYGFFALLS